MLLDIIGVQPLENYRLQIQFEDGIEGVVDVRKVVGLNGVFSVLSDPKEFAAVRVNSELGTICWPCGADLDPDVLYALVTGRPIEMDVDETARRRK